MKKTRMRLLSLIALALLVITVSGVLQDAEAEVRVGAAVRTPNVSVRIGNTYCSHYGGYTRVRIPIRRYPVYRIAERDRIIAHRLAWYTGVPARTLIRLRRYGYQWFEIGRWLRLPRPVVRAAMHHRSWNLFLRKGRLHAGYGLGRHKKLRVVTYYDYN
jgi:hypothetical protein